MIKILISLILISATLFSKPMIVATSHPVSEIVREVAGSSAKVVSILKPGELPNDHKLTPEDIFNSNSAVAIIYSSDLNEDWVLDIPSTKINLSDFIDEDKKRYDKDSNVIDYFWMDPLITKSVAESLADTLGKLDAENAGDYKTNSQKLGERCEFYHKIIDTKLQSCDIKPAFSDLNTLVYFSSRHHMEGGRGFYSKYKSTNSKLRDQFERELVATSAGVIFYNDQIGDSIPKYLSGKLRVEVYPINVYGSDESLRYYDILMNNLDIIVEAFQK